MPKIYYGTSELQHGWDRYYEQYNLFEIKLEGSDRDPSVKTLNRWRVNSPKGFAFVLHAPPAISAALVQAHQRDTLALGAAFERAWEQLLELAHAVAAKAILIATPMEFTPGESSRALLKALSERMAGQKAALIWDAEGLWEPVPTRAWAEEHGIILAHDPFMAIKEGGAPCKSTACFMLNERAGMRRKFDQYDMEDLVLWSSGTQRSFVLLRGRFAHDHARELRHVLSQQ